MVELEPLSTNCCTPPMHHHPSTSASSIAMNSKSAQVDVVSSGQLATLLKRQLADESFALVVLDCRPGSEVSPLFTNAHLIRLPSMLMRRLKAGKLSPVSISPLLADPEKVEQVVVVPDNLGDADSVACLIAQNLLQNHFHLALFQDDPKDFAAHYPELTQSNKNREANGLNFRLFNDGYKYEFKTRESVNFPAQVVNYVYLGNVETAKDRGMLEKHGINYIINVTNDLPNYFEQDPNIHYLRIPVDDTYAHNLAKYFPDAISFIEKARAEGSAVLVHCLAGISRSVTVCLAYLMFAHQSTLDEAFDQLHKQNHSISPNFNFMKSLLNWEREILKHHQHRASSHPQQNRIQYDEDSGNGSSIPSSSTSTTSSTCSSA